MSAVVDKRNNKGLHTRVRTRKTPHRPIMLFYHNMIFDKKQTIFHEFFKKKKFYFFSGIFFDGKWVEKPLEKIEKILLTEAGKAGII